MNRRDFFIRSCAAAGGAGIAFAGFARLAENYAKAQNLDIFRRIGFGPLSPVKALNSNETHLALPGGFQYKVIGRVEDLMSDSRKTPKAHDGMALFREGKHWRVVRNHEINNRVAKSDIAIGTKNHYDETAGGGTTTLVIDPKSREIVRDFVSLSGTLNNCAGGTTPWKSWISCEETTYGPTVYKLKDGREAGGFAKPHGYCFEVHARADDILPPEPLTAMGRFVHEAIAVDPKSGVVYETEDADLSGFYRFIPNRHKKLREGGKLEMLAVAGKANFDTRSGLSAGAKFKTVWVPITEPNPPEADTDPAAVFKQGFARGGAVFARLEGCFPASGGRVFFSSTSGGRVRGGQIWLYEPDGRDRGELTLLFESPDREVLDMPDNICLRPKSELLFICEDSDYALGGTTPGNFVRILSPDGKIADFARNISPGKESSEFAGATFSPDGETLFVNLQTIGLTLAIWGDWKKFK